MSFNSFFKNVLKWVLTLSSTAMFEHASTMGTKDALLAKLPELDAFVVRGEAKLVPTCRGDPPDLIHPLVDVHREQIVELRFVRLKVGVLRNVQCTCYF